MRFVANGPSIPDELLLARDQGRVIFFCGAGVSRAKAKLPDFFGLAAQVNSKLGVSQDSAAHKLIREAQEIDKRIGVSGLISADRVFGLLEREFQTRDIEAAVASALRPAENCDLRAHKILLDLATTDGVVRLVTTNFDRLFDDCGRSLETWQPPKLPDPSRSKELNGIVYLHGRATSNYDGAEGEGFVLSSSEFGRAYLSDGWATSFFREIIRRYVVVFVGYTADDPPVQYLLEALNRSSRTLENVYAFQSGGENDAAARWRHKGVRSIAYNSANEHEALWKTLESWAERARMPEQWHAAVVELAKKGPAALMPHERGQVAHIVSTSDGVKQFAEGDAPPSGEWLCVFDSYRRYARPGHLGTFPERGPYVDPFALYGLDSDTPPGEIAPDDHNPKREIPAQAWDAFSLNKLDWTDLRPDNLPAIRGHWATNVPRLPARLARLGAWIVKVSYQPATIWWAAHQIPLHRDIQNQIRWELERGTLISTPIVRKAWRYVLEAWKHYREPFDRDWHGFAQLIAKDGWNAAAAREYAELMRPRLVVGPAYWGGPRPPANDTDFKDHELFRRDVQYPEQHETVETPDEWVPSLARALRGNLEHALALETEIGGYGLTDISPIVADADNADSYERTSGLSAAVMEFTSLFSRWISLNVQTARQELGSWPLSDDTIFARLRMWAAGKSELMPPAEFGDTILGLSQSAFWDSRHQRDLLLVLAGRWPTLHADVRNAIQDKLLAGPDRWHDELDEKFEERKAWSVLSRIQWLATQGCNLSFDFENVSRALRSKVPDWKPEYGDSAAKSLEGRSGTVTTKTDHASLANEPLASTLSRAKALSGRSDDFLIQNDPYAGLVADRPVHAFSALMYAAKSGEFPEWAWQTFLNSPNRKDDKPRLIVLIAERLSRFSEANLALLVRPASDWFYHVSKVLARKAPTAFDKLAQKLIATLHHQPDLGGSGVIRGRNEPDWATEALNAPAGNVAQALFNDPRKDNLAIGKGFPPSWIIQLEDMLRLPGDMRRHTIVILTFNLNWFYTIDPLWTERTLLVSFNSEHDRDAAWAGFLWGGRAPRAQLLVRLKPALMALAVDPLPSRRDYSEVVAAFVLIGWGSIDKETQRREISNDEMRTLLLRVDDDFRSRVLWLIERWAGTKETEARLNKWPDLLVELLEDVWPRQISAKSSVVSTQLCNLALSSGDRFPQVVDIVLPLLTKIERDHISLPNLRKSTDSVVERFPERTLALLDAVLPENANSWPYGIDKTFERLEQSDSNLTNDERLISLKRRWNAR
ncbi:SIR2 family protein [Reyranella sp.]|uniref:SIR2 family protein n=1 Tax=Reyranella sp. TaxID=1929291 RepID=UPI002731C4CD|nr:SIR2 family protein [Reyranella sp.]MDP2376047.1 SIR2 family protein [Reyranella sp.]